MVRKGSVNYKNDHYHRSETSGRVCKTPRVVLEKLNIPLDSIVLVKGDSIIYPLENSTNRDPDIIDITLSEDEDFQEIMIKRFQSTRDNSIYNKGQSVHSPEKSETFSNDTTPTEQSLERFNPVFPEASKAHQYEKPGPQSLQKITHSRVLGNRIMQKCRTSGKIRKIETQNKQQNQMKNTGMTPFDSDNAEKHIEVKIKNAKFLNVNSVQKDTVSMGPPNICRDPGEADGNDSVKNPKINKHDSNENVLLENKQVRSEGLSSCSTIGEPVFVLEENDLSQQVHKESGTKLSRDDLHTNSTENIIDVTPSRISQRIKNKKVKFSALRLLAGGDIYSLRKDNLKKQSAAKKFLIKTKVRNTADVNANNNSSLSITKAREGPTTPAKDRTDSFLTSTSPISRTAYRYKINNGVKQTSNSKRHYLSPLKKRQRLETIKDDKEHSGENSQINQINIIHSALYEKSDNTSSDLANKETTILTEDKINESSEAVDKSLDSKEEQNVKDVSNKIRLELKGTLQRKVVSITASPLKESLNNQEPRKDTLKERLDIELGPDILIRRVKKQSNDKSVTEGEKNNLRPLSTVQNSMEKVAKNDVKPGSLVVKNLLYAENSGKGGLQQIKEFEVPPQIKKLLLEANKSRKSITMKPGEDLAKINSEVSKKHDETHSKAYINKRKKKLDEYNIRSDMKTAAGKQKMISKGKMEILNSKGDNDPLETGILNKEMLQEREQELFSDLQIVNSSLEEDDSLKSPGESNELEKNAKKSHKILTKGNLQNKDAKIVESRKISKDFETFSSNITRVGGKKTAKVTPLRQVNKPTNDVFKKTINDKMKINNEKELKFQKSKTVPKLTSPSELCILGGKRNYKEAFEKYFICSEKICEHHDSIDSDSSSEDTQFLSHFIDHKRIDREKERNEAESEDVQAVGKVTNTEDGTNLENINPASRVSEDKSDNVIDSNEKNSIHELIKGITVELPKWNWHILPDSSVVCLIVLEREEGGTLDVKKCIEIDSNLKANVYVNKLLVNEYCGVYDGFDAIRNLIYQVDLL